MVKRYKGKKKSLSLFDLFNATFMILLMFVFFYPFWHTIVLSFSTTEYATSLGVKLFPPDITLDSYKAVLSDSSIWVGYANTIFRTVVGTILKVLVCYCAGCALARKNLPFHGSITFFVVFTMLFSGGLIPTFLSIKSYGLVGSRWALILPGLASAWHILIARNYVAGIPGELEEAAMVDGCHPLRFVFQILFPLSKPVLAVLALWGAVGHWNAWFDAMIYTPGDDKIVLQLVLRRLLVDQQSDGTLLDEVAMQVTPDTIKCATIIVAILPIICVYPFIQKHFTKGVMMGAIKG